MRMKWLWGALSAAVLASCATEDSVIMPDRLRAAMRQQATAVLFTDDVGEIRYVWGRFNTPGLNRTDRSVRYGDDWDAGPVITAVHSEELARLGFQAKSIYGILANRDVSNLTAPGHEDRAKNYEYTPLVTPEFAEPLIQRGQRYLFWVTWSGLQYFHPTLPTTPVEQISSSYWLFDLNTRSLVWSGGLADIRDSSFKYADAAAQLEGDQFAGFKRLVESRYRLAYRSEEDSVPWLLGLVRKK
jgi:hypothetical protein